MAFTNPPFFWDTLYVTTKGASKHIKSDHDILFANFILKYQKGETKIKRELFNFKQKEDQEKFFHFTSNSNKFISCFENSGTFEKKSNKFFKTLDDAFHACFKKIRIKSKSTQMKTSEIQAGLDSVNLLKMAINSSQCAIQKTQLETKLKEAEAEVTNLMAEKNAKLVQDHLLQLNSIDGTFNQARIWKLKNKLLPPPKTPLLPKKTKGGIL